MTTALPPLVLQAAARCDADPEVTLSGDARALDRLGVEKALKLDCLPLASAGAVRPVVCPSAQHFAAALPHLTTALGAVAWQTADAPSIRRHIVALRGAALAQRAERRTPVADSCRTWSGPRAGAALLVLVAGLVLAWMFWPGPFWVVLTLWAAVSLVSVTALRTAGAIAEFRHARRLGQTWASRRRDILPPAKVPRISLLVPLFDEPDIAEQLVERLGRITYPRNRLEICLVLESDDHATRAALAHSDLPGWMRTVTVPPGKLKTKPRAMNYALDFTNGDIIGIYDAEDRPAPDQLMRVAEAFAKARPDVACFQGVLDFYNPRQSWLTRCFAIDYAIWFRLVLPGLVRLGVPIPLGGTTVFFRRDILEGLGRWDAHNVTEDADLGLRLARRGFRTEFLPTVTEEEATATIRAWVRQRSRWIKGYAITWAVHMRDPLRLLGELGLVRFLCVQILFLGTLSQFVLAPLLWSFWLIVAGFPHPVTEIVPWAMVVSIGALFFLSEVATLTVAAVAVATPKHNWLIKWVPVMHLYFPLAALASWKGIAELMTRPFFWDKTAHGQTPIRRRASWFFRPRQRPV